MKFVETEYKNIAYSKRLECQKQSIKHIYWVQMFFPVSLYRYFVRLASASVGVMTKVPSGGTEDWIRRVTLLWKFYPLHDYRGNVDRQKLAKFRTARSADRLDATSSDVTFFTSIFRDLTEQIRNTDIKVQSATLNELKLSINVKLCSR